MANPAEIPQLVTEFVEMSKAYLVQETIEPAKNLGRLAGFSVGAALCWALGGVLLSIAVLRWIVRALPDGPYWSALGYLLTVIAIGLVAASMVGLANRSSEGKA
jgi:hypothetical protein